MPKISQLSTIEEFPQSTPSFGARSSSSMDYYERVDPYESIKRGLSSGNPCAIVMWAFHELPSKKGLTRGRVINFVKKRYKYVDIKNVRRPIKDGKSVGVLLKYAVEFGLLNKEGNRYFSNC